MLGESPGRLAAHFELVSGQVWTLLGPVSKGPDLQEGTPTYHCEALFRVMGHPPPTRQRLTVVGQSRPACEQRVCGAVRMVGT